MVLSSIAGTAKSLHARQRIRSHALVCSSCLAHFATTAVRADNAESFVSSGQHAASSHTLIDRVLPRNRFGRSIFTTPLLLLLRLFYQATPFDIGHSQPLDVGPRRAAWKLYRRASSKVKDTPLDFSISSLTECETEGATDVSAKIPTSDWPSLLRSTAFPLDPASTVESMTWVKSLSAPLSHEYLQFVIRCSDFSERYRLVAERDTDGDWTYMIASSNDCESPGSDSRVTQLRPYDYQYDLPLPLLSASWCHMPPSERRTIADLATILARTSKICPDYNVMREHCWWYAELVFEQMLKISPKKTSAIDTKEPESHQPQLKHWPSGSYRYSYIVLHDCWLRRGNLIEQAKAFRKGMDRGGQIQW